jgi:hypothetical protein
MPQTQIVEVNATIEKREIRWAFWLLFAGNLLHIGWLQSFARKHLLQYRITTPKIAQTKWRYVKQ